MHLLSERREPALTISPIGIAVVESNWGQKADRWQTIGDRALVEALRAEVPGAIDEFVSRFESLVLRYARQFGIAEADRAHWAAELLYDVAMTLSRGVGEPPYHLGAYIAGACRMHARRQRLRESKYEARVSEALNEIASSGERVVLELCSESSLQAASGPESERATLPPVLERLVSAFEEGISEEERLLLHWLSCQVSYTTIAAWLGSKRSTVFDRVRRLRERLIEAGFRFGGQLERSERLELTRFLRRTGRISEERIRQLEKAVGVGEAERDASTPAKKAGAVRRGNNEEEPR